MINYGIIGTLTKDIGADANWQIGGTVWYASQVAAELGAQVYAYTTCTKDVFEKLPITERIKYIVDRYDVEMATFHNDYDETGARVQRVSELGSIELKLLGMLCRLDGLQLDVVHIAPLVNELDKVDLIATLPELKALKIFTPQGWFRVLDKAGRVRNVVMQAHDLFEFADVVVLSEEDVDHDADRLKYYANCAKLLILTQGAQGASIYQDGTFVECVPTEPLHDIDPTGAGDIFAAAFAIAMHKSDMQVKEAVAQAHATTREILARS